MSEERRAARRAAMPVVSALLDEWLALFPGTQVVYAVENGISAGKRPDYSNAFRIPADYFPSRPIDVKGKAK
jgi:hypothetical protein